MTYKVNIEMCGDEATEADARNVVDYLNKLGIDAEYDEAAGNRHYDGREPTDAEWKAALNYAVLMGMDAYNLAVSWLAGYLTNTDTSAEEAALSRRGADVSELRDLALAYGLVSNETIFEKVREEWFDTQYKACAEAIAGKIDA